MWNGFLRVVLVAASVFAATAAPAFAKIEIVVDLSAQRMTVTKNRGDAAVWKISSGRDGFETPTGQFTVQRMDPDHHSDEYDQAPMPWSIFFYRGLAIHGTSERGLGSPRSHGCVRLSIPHARELYSLVEQHGASIEITGYAGGGASIYDDVGEDRRRGGKRGKRRRAVEPGFEDFDRYYRY
jgi:lipoprotein-anchoring transpeptidase ErfK/SrfK